MKDMNELKLSDCIGFTKTEPSSCICKTKTQTGWAGLKIPLKRWPRPLFKEWKQDLFYLFPDQFSCEDIESDENVCLCVDIAQCPHKAAAGESRECRWYSRGLCVDATVVENEGASPNFQVIGFFHGVTKQRIEQIYAGARKKLVDAIMDDPYLKELCGEISVGTKALREAETVADRIGRLLAKRTQPAVAVV
jgi:hypothetical protein